MDLSSEPVLSEALLSDLRRYLDANYLEPSEPIRTSRVRRRAEATAFAESAVLENRVSAPYACPSVSADTKRRTGFDALLRQKESSFSEYLITLLNESGEKDSAVYRRAEISRQLFHKILSKKDYQPTKSTALQLALGLRLDLAGTQKLLGKAGYALTRSSKTDLVVQYFIEHNEFSIVTINAALYDCGLPLLKTGSML